MKQGIILVCNAGEHRRDPNLRYLTGFDTEYACAVERKGKVTLYVPEMEYERARRSSRARVVMIKGKRIAEALASSLRGRKVGVNLDQLSVNAFRRLKHDIPASYHDVSEELRQRRAVKSSLEIALLRKACRITDRVFSMLLGKMRLMKTERDVARFIGQKIAEAGAELAFPVIVASGSGAAQPHYVPQDAPLRKGFCVIDFGAKVEGYHADMTRTVYIGKPGSKEQELYQRVLGVQQRLVEDVREGVGCAALYRQAKRGLGKYAAYFIHGLGHGIGVEIHELPNLKPDAKEVLKENMVLTIEPGVYFGGKGIRIEDSVLVKKKGNEVLTRSPKKLIEIR
ncbi:MAG TPA: Xaa-Pro peptidase family protein [Candidatus Nanoarchaeia archaeon]|nr:Xaa-Pro peptidase family protein [Candidatus Nanoarchaeia archaeon]